MVYFVPGAKLSVPRFGPLDAGAKHTFAVSAAPFAVSPVVSDFTLPVLSSLTSPVGHVADPAEFAKSFNLVTFPLLQVIVPLVEDSESMVVPLVPVFPEHLDKVTVAESDMLTVPDNFLHVIPGGLAPADVAVATVKAVIPASGMTAAAPARAPITIRFLSNFLLLYLCTCVYLDAGEIRLRCNPTRNPPPLV
jgi:hypothetical protein